MFLQLLQCAVAAELLASFDYIIRNVNAVHRLWGQIGRYESLFRLWADGPSSGRSQVHVAANQARLSSREGVVFSKEADLFSDWLIFVRRRKSGA